jgi:hypothetical protein
MTAEQLQEEIHRLLELQHKDLQRATYVGLTPDEGRELEARRKQITALVNQLGKLKTPE